MGDSVGYMVTRTGSLKAVLVSSSGQTRPIRLPEDAPKLRKEDLESLRHYPDLNNICFITRAITNPLSILGILQETLASVRDLYGPDWTPDLQYYFSIALDSQVKDTDMIIICFLHFFVTLAPFRQVVLERSDRSFGNYFYYFAISFLRSLYVTLINPEELKTVLQHAVTLLCEIVLTKSIKMCTALLHISFFQKKTELNPFDVLFPVTGRLDSLTDFSFIPLSSKPTTKTEQIMKSLRKDDMSVLWSLTLDEYINLRGTLVSVRPSDYSIQSKKVINELVHLDKMLFEMTNQDKGEYTEDIISHLIS